MPLFPSFPRRRESRFSRIFPTLLQSSVPISLLIDTPLEDNWYKTFWDRRDCPAQQHKAEGSLVIPIPDKICLEFSLELACAASDAAPKCKVFREARRNRVLAAAAKSKLQDAILLWKWNKGAFSKKGGQASWPTICLAAFAQCERSVISLQLHPAHDMAKDMGTRR